MVGGHPYRIPAQPLPPHVFDDPSGLDLERNLPGGVGGRHRVSGQRGTEVRPVECVRFPHAFEQYVEGAFEVVPQRSRDCRELACVAALEQGVARVRRKRAEHVGA